MSQAQGSLGYASENIPRWQSYVSESVLNCELIAKHKTNAQWSNMKPGTSETTLSDALPCSQDACAESY